MISDDRPSVAIIGGGLAGLATAAVASRYGLRVSLFEAHSRLGGRAASFRDPRSGVWLDGCQHVALGCCTALADFARRTGIADCFSRHGRLHFFGPDGARSDVAAGFLPAPLHLAPSLLRFRFLPLGQRLHVLRTMGRLVRSTTADPEKTIGDWLCRQGESAAAVERFWSLVLVGALGDLPDRITLGAARQVFREGFLAARNAYELLIPTAPLAELYDTRVGRFLAAQSVSVHTRTPIRQVLGNAGRAGDCPNFRGRKDAVSRWDSEGRGAPTEGWSGTVPFGARQALAVVLPDGSQQAFDFIVPAVPWHRAAGLLAPELRGAVPSLDDAGRLVGLPISAVHLWFDRPWCPLPHAALVGGPGQWVFRPAWTETAPEHYCQVVISASHRIEFGIDQIWRAVAPDMARCCRSPLDRRADVYFSVGGVLDGARAGSASAAAADAAAEPRAGGGLDGHRLAGHNGRGGSQRLPRRGNDPRGPGPPRTPANVAMRIAHLTAGAGGMYCGGCLHGNTLVAALRRAGHDAALLPVYTPLHSDEPSEAMPRVFFGGLNVYLQQKSALFGHVPRFVHRLLDHPALLRAMGRAAGSTRPDRLGPLTVSMLQGEAGRQAKELDALVDWLADFRPDVVHLFSVLLVGMARQIGKRLGVPVVCTLAGEDLFLEQLPPPHYTAARAALRERAAELAALIAMNHYFADFMAEYLSVPRSRIHVIRPGLNLDGHARPGQSPAAQPRPERTIGYLARIAPEKGLHLLAAAFRQLAADPQLPPLRLRAAGYLARPDRPYLAKIKRELAEAGLADHFEYLGAPDRPGKIAFLQSLDVMGLPTVYRESKGLPVLEAWANGVPAVVPRHGAFPEMLADTGGGLLCEPNDPASLAAALAELLRDPARAAACGRQAQQAVHDRYSAEQMARQTVAVYERMKDEG